MKRYIKRAGAGALLLAAVLAMAIGSVAQSGHFSLDTPDEPGTETPDNPGGDTETGGGTGDGTDTGETTSPSLPVEEGKWYRLQCPTRDNRVIELIAASSPLIGTGESDPHIDRLWSNAAAATNASNYNYQLWHFEPDPENSGYFAMVNYSDPNGSVVLTSTVLNKWGENGQPCIAPDFSGIASLSLHLV